MAGNLLKKSNGLMLLCSISLLMIVMTGCQEAKLKTVIGIANKQCPLDMGEVGKITSIIYLDVFLCPMVRVGSSFLPGGSGLWQQLTTPRAAATVCAFSGPFRIFKHDFFKSYNFES